MSVAITIEEFFSGSCCPDEITHEAVLKDNMENNHVLGEVPKVSEQTQTKLRSLHPLVLCNLNTALETKSKKLQPPIVSWIPTLSNFQSGRPRSLLLFSFLVQDTSVNINGNSSDKDSQNREHAYLRDELKKAASTRESERIIFDVVILLYNLFSSESTVFRANWIAPNITEENINILHLFLNDLQPTLSKSISKKDFESFSKLVFNKDEKEESLRSMNADTKTRLEENLGVLKSLSYDGGKLIACSSLSDSELRLAVQQAIFKTFQTGKDEDDEIVKPVITVLSKRLSFSICHFLRNVYTAHLNRLDNKVCPGHRKNKRDQDYCPICLQCVKSEKLKNVKVDGDEDKEDEDGNGEEVSFGEPQKIILD